MRLLYLDSEQIMKMIEGMDREVKSIKRNAQRIAWYSRGSIQYADVLNMSPDDLKIANEIIEENLDTTKKANLPFF